MISSLLPKPKNLPYFFNNKLCLEREKIKSVKVLNSSHLKCSQTKKEITKIKDLIIEDSIDQSNLVSSKDFSENNNKIQSDYSDTVPLKKKYPHLIHYFPKVDASSCEDSSIKQCIEETKSVIDNLLNSKKKSVTGQEKKSQIQFITYSDKSIVNNVNEMNDDNDFLKQNKVIQVKNLEQDPMLPSRFKLLKNKHKDSLPLQPILKNKDAEKKLTKADREKWAIPPSVSNWKNNLGFIIPLNKRTQLANGGFKKSDENINLEKFQALTSSLEKAEKKARNDFEIRNTKLMNLKNKIKQENEINLRKIAFTEGKIENHLKRSSIDFEQSPIKKIHKLNDK